MFYYACFFRCYFRERVDTLAAILQEAGYKTGLYTSPHLVDFRERIRVNGKMIPKDDVVDFVRRFRYKNLSIAPSFFELTMVMAFDFFAKEHVDVAVIEVGLPVPVCRPGRLLAETWEVEYIENRELRYSP